MLTQEKEVTTFVHEDSVRISDVNYGNHLDFARLLDIVGNARKHYFNSLGFDELNISGVGIITIALNVKYMRQGMFSDLLLIKINPLEKKKMRLTLEFLVVNKKTKETLSKGEISLAFFDYQLQKSVPMPDLLAKVI